MYCQTLGAMAEFKFENEDGDVIMKPVAEFHGRSMPIGLVLAVRYLDTPEAQKNWDLTTVQFLLTHRQCLDLADLLRRQAAILEAHTRNHPKN
jgi:hypothetical protein